MAVKETFAQKQKRLSRRGSTWGGEQTHPESNDPPPEEDEDYPIPPPEPPPAAPVAPPRGEQLWQPTPPSTPAPGGDFLDRIMGTLFGETSTLPWLNRSEPQAGFLDRLLGKLDDFTNPLTPTGSPEDIASVTAEIQSLMDKWGSMFNITGEFGQTGGPYPATGHIGLDMVPKGADWSVYAPLAGTVLENGYSNGYGNYLKLRHADGTVTLYAHMAAPSPWQVGQQVGDGQQIGTIGETGYAKGVHLHFEVYDPEGRRYDPLKWLNGDAPADYAPVGGAPQPSPTAPRPGAPTPSAPPSGQWTQQDAIDAIWYWTQQYGYSSSFYEFALAIAYGESGWNPYAVGDNGASFGIFQFYTKGGRGDGYSPDQLYNPYFEAQIDLPYLYAAYMKHGGDSGWASDPAYVLKHGWHDGQGAIWADDAAISRALAAARGGSAPSASPTDPGADIYDSSTSPFHMDARSMPPSDFLARLIGAQPETGSDFLSRLLADMGLGVMAPPQDDFLSRILGTPPPNPNPTYVRPDLR